MSQGLGGAELYGRAIHLWAFLVQNTTKLLEFGNLVQIVMDRLNVFSHVAKCARIHVIVPRRPGWGWPPDFRNVSSTGIIDHDNFL